MAREAFRLHRGDDGGDVEHLGGLGQAHGIVFQRLAVHRLHAERHLRLLVDEDDLAIVGGKDFQFRIGHDVIHEERVEWVLPCIVCLAPRPHHYLNIGWHVDCLWEIAPTGGRALR
ncbi:hypothetical protein D3C81_1368300 [compost metagenome]